MSMTRSIGLSRALVGLAVLTTLAGSALAADRGHYRGGSRVSVGISIGGGWGGGFYDRCGPTYVRPSYFPNHCDTPVYVRPRYIDPCPPVVIRPPRYIDPCPPVIVHRPRYIDPCPPPVVVVRPEPVYTAPPVVVVERRVETVAPVVVQAPEPAPQPQVVYQVPARYYQTPAPTTALGRDELVVSTARPVAFRPSRPEPISDNRVGRAIEPRPAATVEILGVADVAPDAVRISAVRAGELVTLTITGTNRASGFVTAVASGEPVDGVPSVTLKNTPPAAEDGKRTDFATTVNLRVRGQTDQLIVRAGGQLYRVAITDGPLPQ